MTHRWHPPHTRYDMLRHELHALLKRIVWRCSNRALSRAISRWRVTALRQGDADLRRALGAAGIDLSVLRERHNTLETQASSLSSRVDAFVQKVRHHRRYRRRRFHRFRCPALLLILFHHTECVRLRATCSEILFVVGHQPAAA